MTKKVDLKKIAVLGMLCAVAFLLTFTLRFKVSFLTFDVKDAVLAVCSLIYGPIYGVCAAVIVALLEFLSVSDTGVYGLIMNAISSGTFALVCGLIYKYKRTFVGAIIAVGFAALGTVCVMMVANLFITPFYMGVERSDVIALIPSLLFPFNLCKTVINAALTMLIYKPVTHALRRIGILGGGNGPTAGLRTVLAAVISAVVIVLAVLFFLLKLDGALHIF